MRNARRSLVLAAVLLGASLGASACTAREGTAAAAPAGKVNINAPHATSPDFVTEPLWIETAAGRIDYRVEIADDDAERQHGLMFRTSMPDGHGMLFIFPQARPQAFWMRNTYMPLDIIYIGANGRVVSISRNARPLDESPQPSAGPAQYVLELAGGRAEQIGLLPGDRVLHRALPRG